jgi:hypothetical protein
VAVKNNNSSLNIGTIGVTYLGDLNDDFTVNGKDIATFVSDYLSYYSSSPNITAAIDYNQDGKINFNDLTLFVHYYIIFYQTNG